MNQNRSHAHAPTTIHAPHRTELVIIELYLSRCEEAELHRFFGRIETPDGKHPSMRELAALLARCDISGIG